MSNFVKNQQEVIMGLKAKDKKAVEHLYDKYSPALYGLVFRMVHSEAVAQDILQDSFIKIWNNGASYNEQKGSLFTWMIRITRNTTLNYLQSKAHKNNQKNQSLENLVHLSENKTLIQQIDVNNIGLRGLVAQLEDKYKVIIDLIYFQGFTQKEVQEALEIPLGTVKSRVRIALRELRKKFDHVAPTIFILPFIHLF